MASLIPLMALLGALVIVLMFVRLAKEQRASWKRVEVIWRELSASPSNERTAELFETMRAERAAAWEYEKAVLRRCAIVAAIILVAAWLLASNPGSLSP